MKREPRNPDISFKPAVVSWFNKHTEAKAHFDPIIKFLVEHYSGSNYGFINKKAYPEYRFNSIGNGEIYVVIRASQSHSIVRFRIDSAVVEYEFSDYCKNVAAKDGSRIDVVDFIVEKTNDLKLLNDFLRRHEIHNFKQPKINSWKEHKVNSADGYTSIRLQSGKEVEVTHGHLELSKKFINWLKKNGFKNIKNEFILANFDRIDVLFKMNRKNILSELKTVSGSSTKRVIREALGQILDYQYYHNSDEADELWIVVNDECTELDVRFVKQLRERHKLPLRLVWTKNQGFASFPKLQRRI